MRTGAPPFARCPHMVRAARRPGLVHSSAWKVCSRTLDGAEACRYTHGVVHGLRISASLREMRRARFLHQFLVPLALLFGVTF
jgi:hypothetical protein